MQNELLAHDEYIQIVFSIAMFLHSICEDGMKRIN